ncbi:hypothetical protein AB0I28_33445 [Phytomonospora sp. NPDC050363]|uniref:hypothetical protein n=1 Tax=Phytomonospora sp. NPDC050363 TaxID=3155642 RepID=UPI0033F434F6
MDPIALFAAPAVGVAYNVLVDLARGALARWYSGRADETVPAPDRAALRGTLEPLRMDPAASTFVPAIAGDLDVLVSERYEGSLQYLSPDDALLMEALARLRANLEALFGQRITFRGEDARSESGARVRIRLDVADIDENSEVTGMSGGGSGEDINVHLRARNINGGSKIVGYKRGDE